MIFGFTGTRAGMTRAQFSRVRQLLQQFRATELHHGDCIGADAQVHEIGLELGLRIVIHPPVNPKLRACCEGERVETLPELPYLERNTEIVKACSRLIAAPCRFADRSRGTWGTYREAERLGKSRLLVDYLGFVS